MTEVFFLRIILLQLLHNLSKCFFFPPSISHVHYIVQIFFYGENISKTSIPNDTVYAVITSNSGGKKIGLISLQVIIQSQKRWEFLRTNANVCKLQLHLREVKSTRTPVPSISSHSWD